MPIPSTVNRILNPHNVQLVTVRHGINIALLLQDKDEELVVLLTLYTREICLS